MRYPLIVLSTSIEVVLQGSFLIPSYVSGHFGSRLGDDESLDTEKDIRSVYFPFGRKHFSGHYRPCPSPVFRHYIKFYPEISKDSNRSVKDYK